LDELNKGDIMANYFKVIDGIKYDIGQAVDVCYGQYIYESEGSKRFKSVSSFLNKQLVLIETEFHIFITDVIIKKGINGNYFIYTKDTSQLKIVDEINHIQELKNVDYNNYEYIMPITRDQAVQYYFNGYYLRNYQNQLMQFNHILSEEEAFEGIPIA
jgi:hypothetical protein